MNEYFSKLIDFFNSSCMVVRVFGIWTLVFVAAAVAVFVVAGEFQFVAALIVAGAAVLAAAVDAAVSAGLLTPAVADPYYLSGMTFAVDTVAVAGVAVLTAACVLADAGVFAAVSARFGEVMVSEAFARGPTQTVRETGGAHEEGPATGAGARVDAGVACESEVSVGNRIEAYVAEETGFVGERVMSEKSAQWGSESGTVERAGTVAEAFVAVRVPAVVQ